MFRKTMRNISRYKGHYIAVGVLTLVLSVGSCLALTMRKTASQFSGFGFSVRGTDAQSFSPFENLSRYAGIALLILAAAGVVLFIVLTALNVHKRAGEICTCRAIGMKKTSVVLQFAAEIVAVTMAAAIVGTAIGYFISAPAANALLKTQMSSLSQQMRSSGSRQFGGQYNQGDGNTDGNTYGSGNPAGGQTDNSQAGARQRANNNQENSSQSGGNPAGGDNRGSGSAGWGENGGGSQRSSSGGMRGVSASPDILVLLETLGIGLGFAVFSSGAAAVAVFCCEPMKIMNPKRG